MPLPVYVTSSNLLLHTDQVSRSPAYFLAICVQKTAHSFGRMIYLRFPLFCLPQPSLSNKFKRWGWSIRSSTDGNSVNSSPAEDTSGGTRLIRIIKSFQTKLDKRIKELRQNLPMKLLFFLVGFYCATAFATVIGQTGDWDILSAALAVAIVEGIGALMYTASIPLIGNARSLITMFNYWKAGLSLGLFLDSFKY